MNAQITDSQIRQMFSECDDFVVRELRSNNMELYAYAIDGLVSGSQISQDVLRPISDHLAGQTMAALYENAFAGQIYNSVARECQNLQDVAMMLVNGFSVVLFPGVGAIAFEAKTGEKRSVSPPEVENTVKGPKDAFTETVRTNSSLLRRHLRTPALRLYAMVMGRRSMTRVLVVWIDGLTDPELVRRMKKRLEENREVDLVTPAAVEETVTGARATPFPLLQYTERPDKFAQSLLAGRVGLMVDGLPLGYLAPVDLGYLMYSPEDYGMDAASSICIRVLRYGALLLSLLLPGFYIALAVFHHEMIPIPLLRAIIESRQSVPFSTVTEVLSLLIAFELLQEAGIHLPQSIGQSVSIIGGIVVGTAAVEASMISPAALIVVSLAGICGFALPNRDFAEAIRLWRFLLALVAAGAGLFGIAVAGIVLLIRLSGVESLGAAYLAPFSEIAGLSIVRSSSEEGEK